MVTDLGRGYHVRCRYKSREAAAAAKIVPTTDPSVDDTNDDNVDNVLDGDDDDDNKGLLDRRDHGRALGQKNRFTSNEIPMPACHMKIYAGEAIAENVKIGDPLTLKIFIDKQARYGLHVMECLVRDGLGWGEQTLVKFG